LLSSLANDLHFVAELDNEGRAHLRFGNGELGRKLEAGMKFHAKYRTGNGLAGNVGADSISHVVLKNNQFNGFKRVRNPMPAQGGTEREPISEVKLFAPHAFRKDLQRAVIADDYAAIVLREFKNKVQNAVAKLRWNGSWYEVWVAVDPFGREEADQALLDEITGRLHRYRRIGHDLVVKSAQRVPLDIELAICVRSNYLRGHVKAELLNIFSNKRLANGKIGFFHPDKLTFGDDIYLSKIVAAAQSVQGIESVEVTKMQRFGELKNNEIEKGLLPLSPFEIARLDNDPSFPENGKLVLDMRGGR
jgi:predicted phage baseplate assembly protein